jgi:hypothetical protein
MIGAAVSDKAASVLHRELTHSGLLQEGASYSARLLGCTVLGATAGGDRQ